MPEESNKRRMSQEIKTHESEKKLSGLLSSNLGDIKDKYKANDDDMHQMILSADDSYEEYKEKYLESLKVINPNVTPVGQEIITTARLMNFMDQGKALMGLDFDANVVSQFKDSIDDVQRVLAVGPACQQLKVGDKVKVRMTDFYKVKNPNSVHSKDEALVPIETINDVDYMSMHERNIKFVFNS